jgi:glutamate carboxypeptidase
MTGADRVELLRELVELESPTGETGAIAARLERELEALGATVERDGEHLVGGLGGDGAPLLVLAHMDTVWPLGTLEAMPWRADDGRAFGPGVYDMKAGIVVMLDAVARAGATRALRLVITADEEIGSPDGRRVLGRAAEGASAALVVEPPDADGHLKTARKGLGRFTVRVTGRPAHASAAASGVSAIEELAHQILRLQTAGDLERGTSFNVGVVSGGTGENVVAPEALAKVDVRVARAEDRAGVERFLGSLEPVLEGTAIEVGGGWTRPPLERSPGSDALFAAARRHGLELGLDLEQTSSGGGSDGNLVGALGVPVLDGLGALGGGAHAPDEHVELASLEIRAELLARILRDPGV